MQTNCYNLKPFYMRVVSNVIRDSFVKNISSSLNSSEALCTRRSRNERQWSFVYKTEYWEICRLDLVRLFSFCVIKLSRLPLWKQSSYVIKVLFYIFNKLLSRKILTNNLCQVHRTVSFKINQYFFNYVSESSCVDFLKFAFVYLLSGETLKCILSAQVMFRKMEK